MKRELIQKMLELHEKWLRGEADGQRANFERADFQGTDFRGTDFQGANCRGANFREANFQGANFEGANFQGADLDFSCWPLWCGSLNVVLDDRLKAQLLYHLISAIGVDDFTPEQIARANTFHRVGELRKLSYDKGEK